MAVATSVNLIPAASAVKATAGNKKHNDDDEKKGSGVHGCLLAIKLSNYPRANEYEPYLGSQRPRNPVLPKITTHEMSVSARCGEFVQRSYRLGRPSRPPTSNVLSMGSRTSHSPRRPGRRVAGRARIGASCISTDRNVYPGRFLYRHPGMM